MSNKSYISGNGEAKKLDGAFFEKAKRGRPALAPHERKQRVTMFVDPDIIAHFKKNGRGWQTRLNDTLRKAIGL